MAAAGYHLSQKSKTYHALDSFVYEYQNAGGMKDNLKIEINYMLRCHVLAPVRRTVNLPWLEQELTVLSVDPLEIYGSKIVALLNRAAPRDLYDIHTMMEYGLFDESQEPMLKKCVMFYSAIGSDSVPDRFHFEQIASVSQQRVKTDLIPVLRRGTWFDAQQAHEQVIAYLEKPADAGRTGAFLLDFVRQAGISPGAAFSRRRYSLSYRAASDGALEMQR